MVQEFEDVREDVQCLFSFRLQSARRVAALLPIDGGVAKLSPVFPTTGSWGH